MYYVCTFMRLYVWTTFQWVTFLVGGGETAVLFDEKKTNSIRNEGKINQFACIKKAI